MSWRTGVHAAVSENVAELEGNSKWVDPAAPADIKLALCDENVCSKAAAVGLSEGAMQRKPQKPKFGSEGAMKCGRAEGFSVQAWVYSNLG